MSRVNKVITDTTIKVEPIYKAQSDAYGIFDYPFLIEMINNNNVSRVLDIGTGEGSFLIGLAQKTIGVQFDAIDLNKDLIEIGKSNNERLRLNINFTQANFGENYTESDYDLITARFAIEHISEVEDIDSFIASTYKRLKKNGWLVIIEYYVHVLDIVDTTWKRFRKSEISTYECTKAHPRIALKLPESFTKAKYKNIKSTINHISPSTIGTEKFYILIQEYAKLYSQITPAIWTSEIIDEISTWCNKKEPAEEPSLFTTYTIGQKLED